jgi:predicted DNA-binding transcriptional regulator AlpA
MTLLNGREAALALRLSERTLERLRVNGLGPRFVKLGKAVRYQQEALEKWIEAHSRASTSEGSA